MRPSTLAVDAFIATAGYWFCTDPPTHLECSICHLTLKRPVCCDSGIHTFCRECVAEWQKHKPAPVLCPLDRGGLINGGSGPRRAPLAVQDCIDRLQIKCSLVCGWSGNLAEWRNHLRFDCSVAEGHNDLESFLPKAEAIVAGEDVSGIAKGSAVRSTAPDPQSLGNSQLSREIVTSLREEMQNIIAITRQENENFREDLREFLVEQFRSLSTQTSKPESRNQQSHRKAAARLVWSPGSTTSAPQVPAKILLPASLTAASAMHRAPAVPATPATDSWTTVTSTRFHQAGAATTATAPRSLPSNEWPDILHTY